MDHFGKPEGTWGKLTLKGMNKGHQPLTEWAFEQLQITTALTMILDVGCGGGAVLTRLLATFFNSEVHGVDYSATSVAVSKKVNATQLDKRCFIQQADVCELPFSDLTFDLVTAFETIYFWPDLEQAFCEINRVLKKGGYFLICCESDGSDGETWDQKITGMRYYPSDELVQKLAVNGFAEIRQYRNDQGWICLIGSKC